MVSFSIRSHYKGKTINNNNNNRTTNETMDKTKSQFYQQCTRAISSVCCTMSTYKYRQICTASIRVVALKHG